MLLQTLFRRSTSLLSLSGFVSGQATMSTQVPSSLWKLGRLNHVAIATPDLLKSVSLYRDIMGAAVRYIISNYYLLKIIQHNYITKKLSIFCFEIMIVF